MYSFFEFFAGGGMARLGLGRTWTCAFANDFSAKKAEVYEANFPDDSHLLRVDDVADISLDELPGSPDLVWGSFPCQDLSVAGAGAGLNGERSGVFWPFWKLVEGLKREERGPKIVVLENVEGILTSHGGEDFRTVVGALSGSGYRVGALTVDAVHFLPQSRPRVFFIAVSKGVELPRRVFDADLTPSIHGGVWRSEALRTAQRSLSKEVRTDWVWWRMAPPKPREMTIADILEPHDEVRWDSADVTRRLLAMMSEVNLAKVRQAKGMRTQVVGTIYKRTRNGLQRAEVRFDGISGCLRTPGGGSSRQTILLVEGEKIRSRLLTPREAARLMGIPDSYVLPANYNHAYHVAGDGLAVPAVAWIEQKLLRPIIRAAHGRQRAFIGEQREAEQLVYA
jgi:DNA (cytosine-5)-methyltransferase 1